MSDDVGAAGAQETITRVWDAPIELIWELWTTAEGIASLFGPRGWTVQVLELDRSVGGIFRYSMRKDGADAPPRVVESRVTVHDPPHRFAYESPWGTESMTTSAEFVQGPDGVTMTLVISATMPNMLGGAMMGWRSSLERFGEQLAG